MIQNLLKHQHEKKAERQNRIKKAALQGIRVSLAEERYEDCGKLIARAEKFGAAQEEIRQTIEGSQVMIQN